MQQVVAPDEPGVQTGRLDLSGGHVLCLEEVDQFAIGPYKSIFGAAGDPEQERRERAVRRVEEGG